MATTRALAATRPRAATIIYTRSACVTSRSTGRGLLGSSVRAWKAFGPGGLRGLTEPLCRAVETDTEVVETELEDEDFTAAVDERVDVTFNGKNNGIYSVTGVLKADAPAPVAYDILTDYGASENIFNNILGSETKSGPDGRPMLVQDCRWSFLVFQGKFQATLAVTEDPEQNAVDFDLVDSGFMKHFCGRWTVEPTADGGCTVTHNLEVKPTLAPPPPLGFYTKRIFVKQVGEIMVDLEKEINRRHGSM